MEWKLIWCVLAPWLLTRVMKLCQDVYKARKFHWRMLFNDGGFPSSHAAFVFGLVGFFLFATGPTYWLYISLVMAIVVSYDAFNVRWFVGEQAKVLNRMNAKVKGYKPLQERVGHTFVEVLGGAAIGIIVPWLIFLFFP